MSTSTLMELFDLTGSLARRAEQGLLRTRTEIAASDGRYIWQAEQRYLQFSSNDYLALAHHDLLKKAYQQGVERYGTGSGASPLINGYRTPHRALEEAIANWLGVEGARLFHCGFSANQAVLKSLLGKDHLLWQDRLNHASLQEMGHLLPCKMKRFAHNDMQALSQQLVNRKGLIVSEGVFSMDGDQGPWASLVHLAKESANALMIDDAHGIGVLGVQGRGTLAAQGIDPRLVDVHMATFGKAFGVAGAFVAGSYELMDYLTNFAPSYVYSTHMPPAQAHTLLHSLQLIKQYDEPRAHLHALIARFRQGALQTDWSLTPSQTPIQPLIVGSSEQALALAKALRLRGIWVNAIRPPTVPKGTARLRITFTAAHQFEDVDYLLESLTLARQQCLKAVFHE